MVGTPTISVTQYRCPGRESGDPSTPVHHLVPRTAKGGPRGAREQACRYCGKSEYELRAAIVEAGEQPVV